MGKTKGLRRGTRSKHARPFRQNGMPSVSTYMTSFKLGDYVDIVTNGAIHKGMPYHFYHGRTGRVWNITPRAIGVAVTKQVHGKILEKKIHVRLEHLRPSRCHEGHLDRVRCNDAAKLEAKANKGAFRPLKRAPALPVGGKVVKMHKAQPETLHAVPYELMF